ncbi:hypothetical protein [Anaerotignum sp.]
MPISVSTVWNIGRQMEKLTNAVTALKTNQENLEEDVGEIKADVKKLVEKPAKRWDGVVDKGLAVIVGAIVGFLLNGGGIP